MTREALEAWMSEMAWTNRRLAKELGVHENTVWNWIHGRTPIPRSIALACRALKKGLAPYDSPA